MLARYVIYTDVDGLCDKLVTDDRYQFTTLTAHLSWQYLRRTISRSRDMVGTHQNLNGSRYQGRFAIRGLALATVILSTKFEVSIFTQYELTKIWNVMLQSVENGVVWG